MDLTLWSLWPLRGQQPAQETRILDDENTDISGPISERMVEQEAGAPAQFSFIGFKFVEMGEA